MDGPAPAMRTPSKRKKRLASTDVMAMLESEKAAQNPQHPVGECVLHFKDRDDRIDGITGMACRTVALASGALSAEWSTAPKPD